MRTFIAVPVDDAIRSRLAQAQDRLRAAPCTVKWVRPEQMHVTVKFLGEIEPEAVSAVAEAMAAAARGMAPFDMAITGLGAFPGRGAPRVVWAGADDDGSLAAFHDRLEEHLEPLGVERETRAFSAHLTIGRARDRRGAGPLRRPIDAEARTPFGSQRVAEVVLFRSVLSPAGPAYTRLHTQALAGAAATR